MASCSVRALPSTKTGPTHSERTLTYEDMANYPFRLNRTQKLSDYPINFLQSLAKKSTGSAILLPPVSLVIPKLPRLQDSSPSATLVPQDVALSVPAPAQSLEEPFEVDLECDELPSTIPLPSTCPVLANPSQDCPEVAACSALERLSNVSFEESGNQKKRPRSPLPGDQRDDEPFYLEFRTNSGGSPYKRACLDTDTLASASSVTYSVSSADIDYRETESAMSLLKISESSSKSPATNSVGIPVKPTATSTTSPVPRPSSPAIFFYVPAINLTQSQPTRSLQGAYDPSRYVAPVNADQPAPASQPEFWETLAVPSNTVYSPAAAHSSKPRFTAFRRGGFKSKKMKSNLPSAGPTVSVPTYILPRWDWTSEPDWVNGVRFPGSADWLKKSVAGRVIVTRKAPHPVWSDGHISAKLAALGGSVNEYASSLLDKDTVASYELNLYGDGMHLVYLNIKDDLVMQNLKSHWNPLGFFDEAFLQSISDCALQLPFFDWSTMITAVTGSLHAFREKATGCSRISRQYKGVRDLMCAAATAQINLLALLYALVSGKTLLCDTEFSEEAEKSNSIEYKALVM